MMLKAKSYKINLKVKSIFHFTYLLLPCDRKSVSSELPFANFSFLNKYNYICVRNSRRAIVKRVVNEKTCGNCEKRHHVERDKCC